MTTIMFGRTGVTVPNEITGIDRFREWVGGDDFPEDYRAWWLGAVWIDVSKEQIFTHVRLKTEITSVLHRLVTPADTGLLLADGVLLSNFEADISGNPDAMYIAHESTEAGRVRFIEGKEGGYVEVQGSPDMVLEVVSDGSQQKDNVTLKESYWKADVREYWIVDARGEELEFAILQHTGKGYVAVKRQAGGWLKSPAFGVSFRITRGEDRAKHPMYTLHVRGA